MQKKSQRLFVVSLAFTLVLSIAMSAFMFFSFSAGAVSVNGLSTITALNLRSSASTSSTVITLIPKGKEVILLADSVGGWSKVKYASYTGYCSNDYLNALSGSGVTMKAKTTDDVNLRSGMGTSYTSLAVVPRSTILSVSSNADDTWTKVTYSGKTGYIRKDYLEINFTLKTVETTITPSTTKPTESGFSYSNPDLSGIPCWYNYSLTDSLLSENNSVFTKLMLSKSSLKLDVNESYKLTAFVSKAVSVMENVSFSSSDSSIVSVDKNGVVLAKAEGKATVIATDLLTKNTAKCTVIVSGEVLPSQKPSETTTEKPSETVKPTTPSEEASTAPPTTVEEELSLSASNATIYVNNVYLINATSNATVSWSSSDTSIATVSGGLVTAKSSGTVTITAKTSKKTATCKITVKKATTTVNVSHTKATVTAGKTYLATSSTSSVTWSSSNTSVATVKNGYILGVSKGQAVVTVSKSGGAQTILVTVTDSAPIRFAYTSPNCATKNGTVTLIAITDKNRTEVKFDVTVGSTTKTVNATSKTADGNTLIWKGTTSFSSAGTYSVKAYSKLKSTSNWATCSDASTTAFVTNSTDKTTTVCANRRASDEIINLIATFEGFVGTVYEDAFTGDPTLGYGRLVYSGQQFYNSLTKREAYAYLVQTVNNDGYTSKVNSFLVDNGVKFNQQQFDALVCFVYNTGTGVLSNDDEIRNALLNCSSGTSTTTTSYYINGSSVRIRKGPGTSYDIIKELSYGTKLTILEKTSSSWYYVQLADGTKGYVSTDYISSKVSSGSLDLNYVNKQTVINKICQYHHAGGCVYGLLYRRIDEMEVFFYNEYEADYGSNEYSIQFSCASNPSFHI